MPVPHALHWVLAAPSPYNARLFAALARDPHLDLTVHYYLANDPDRFWRRPHGDTADAYSDRTFRSPRLDPKILRIAADRRNRLVVAGWNVPSVAALLLELAALGRPYLFWTDTPKSHRRSLPKRVARSALSRLVFRSAAAVLTTGTPGVEAVRAMGCPSAKTVNFPPFCDLAALQRPGVPSADLAAGPLRIASAGRLAPIKRYDTALRALARFRDAAPSVASRYDLAGAGPEEVRLRNLTVRLGLGAVVRFRGWLEADETATLLRECDLFLHPAAVEPYGMAVIEAMAAGAVVLGSEATGAVRDRIRDGENGLVHPTGDAEALAAQLSALAGNRERIHSLGAAAAATAREWPLARGVRIIRRLLDGVAPAEADIQDG